MTETATLHDDLEEVCAHLEPFRHELGGRSIFLAGCTGFIGRWLLDALHWASEAHGYGLRLTALVRSSDMLLRRFPELAKRKELTLVEGSFPNLPEDAIPPFDLAIHGVTLHDDGTPAWPAQLCATLCQGSENFMRLAQRRGCRRVLYLSSGAVYGCPALGKGFPITEEEATLRQRLRQSSLYGESKRYLELMLTALGQSCGIEITVARCFAFCGRHLNMSRANALPSILQDALAGREIILTGDGLAQRSFLYGTDMAVHLLACLVHGADGAAYNVGSARAVTIRELAEIIAHLAGGRSNVRVLGQPNHGNAPSRYVPDTRRIQEKLGVRETVELNEGLRRTLLWARACNGLT